MPAWGITPAGFVAKPYAQILQDIQTAQLATMSAAIDLSPTGPLGQQNGIVANAMASLWALLGTAYNSFNRQAVEGAGADNLGDLTGIPREGGSYTQVACTLTFSNTSTFAPGTLVANVAGNTALTFANLYAVTGATTVGNVVMQSLVIGETPSINPGTLTAITNPVSGWTSITNPLQQSVLGSNEELDAAYVARQEKELGSQGSCNPHATVAALVALGAAQSPPIPVTVELLENTGNTNYTPPGSSLVLPPNSYALVIYDGATGWATGAGEALIAATIWANKPAGIGTIGTIAVTYTDPLLGNQIVYFSTPTPVPLYFQITIVVRTGFTFASVSAAVQQALITASTAATPAGGIPPNGQLGPGADAIGSQFEAVIMSVPGVYDVQVLQFGTTFGSTNTAPIVISATQIARVISGNDGGGNPYFSFTNGTGP
jgi:uncharacterized phage protein gp47/JayE